MNRARRPISLLGAFALILSAVIVPLVVGQSPAAAGPPPVMHGYVPLPADQMWDAMNGMRPFPSGENTLDFTVGLTNAGAGAIIYYDQWENGYEGDIANPAQANTLVFGDGDPSNGDAALYCGVCTGDLLPQGASLILRNNIVRPRDAATVRFDGRDKIASTRGFVITAGGFGTVRQSLQASVVSSFDTSKYGTAYTVPVGIDTPYPAGTDANAFGYTGAVIQAAAAGTVVNIDQDADGTVDVTRTLAEGEATLVASLRQGATITSSAPVQVHLATGEPGATYESRWFPLFPDVVLSDTYLSMAGSNVNNFRTINYLYNPNDTAITVTPTCTGVGCGTPITVPAKASASFASPLNQGVSFASAGGETFIGVAGVGAQSGANPGGGTDQSSTWDWGFTMIPASQLTSQVVLGWAPGNSNNPPASPAGARNYNPVWFTTTSATTVFVDYDGDPDTGAIAGNNCFGTRYDQALTVSALETVRVHDPIDGDMSGARIYTCDGTKVSAAWGEDPSVAPTGAPGFDAGYTVMPFTSVVLDKSATLALDNNGDSLVSPGDVVTYEISVANAADLAFINVAVQDVLQPGMTYVPGSTVLDQGVITPLADDATPPASTAFPLDESGANVPTIAAGQIARIRYNVRVDLPYVSSKTTLANSACIEGPEGQLCDTVVTPLTQADLELRKTQTGSPTQVGDQATFRIEVDNKGPDAATGVEVTDLLPAGTTFVSSNPSQGSYDENTGLWKAGTIANGGTAWLEIVATIDVTTVTNFAEVTSVEAVDIDSQPGENPLDENNPPDQDDEDSVIVQVEPTPLADLSLTKGVTTAPTYVGDLSTYTIVVSNAGPAAATGVQVTDQLPAGLTFVSATATQGAHNGGTGIWTVGAVPAGGSATLTVTARVMAPGTISNTAQVTKANQSDPDSTPGNSNPDEDDQDSAIITTTGASVGDRIWFDIDDNGVQDPGEPGLEGITLDVVWFGPDGVAGGGDDVTHVATTGADGLWMLNDLPSGSYRATRTGALPAGISTPTFDLDGVGTANTTLFALSGGQDRNDVDFGYTGSGSIGDTVFNDANTNGTPDAGEGIAAVTVTATWLGFDGVAGGGDDVTYTTTTDVSGLYLFSGLPDGAFVVTVDTTTLPAGMTNTVDPDGGANSTSSLTITGGADRLDQDFGYIVPGIDLYVSKSDGGMTATPGQTVIYTIQYGNHQSATTSATGVVLTETVPANASFNAASSAAGWTCVGSTCTLAVGTLAPGASGSAAFAVTVASPVAAGVNQLSNTVKVADDGTHGNDPNPGDNTGTDTTPIAAAPDLVVTKTDSDTTSTPGGLVLYTIDYSNVGNQDATGVLLTEALPVNTAFAAGSSTAGWTCVASTCKLVVGALPAGGSGSVTFAVTVNSPLPAGVTSVSNTVTVADDNTNGTDPTPPNNTDDENTPVQVATIGDRVWHDTNTDGVQTAGDNGIANVTVVLYDGAGNPVAATVTDAGGIYSFTGLPAGDYRVGITTPAGYTLSPSNVGSDDAADSDLDPTTGRTTTFSVATGETITSVDAGLYRLSTVSGSVFVDTDNDGVRDPGELGIEGVTVTLTGTDDLGSPVSVTTTSGSDGTHSFPGLRAGTYTVTETQPASYLDGKDAVGSAGGTLGDDVVSAIVLTDGTNATGYNFGEIAAASLSGSAFADTDDDGVRDPGESGIEGVTVTLTGTDDLGSPVSVTTTTGPDGSYSFTGLRPGTYTVTETQPTGYLDGKDAAGNAGGTLGNDTVTEIVLGSSQAGTGYTFGELLPASIGDFVWADTNGDGIQDPSESGLGGVALTLLADIDGDGTYETTVAVTTTSPTGQYLFENLRPGDYRVDVDQTTAPEGFVGTTPDPLDVSVMVGQEFVDADFGFRPPAGTIGDFVWADTNGDGVQDVGEPGLGGVMVTIQRDRDGDGVYETTVDSQVTSGTGTYLFENLPAGSYQVVVTTPSGLTPSTDTTIAVDLGPDKTNLDADFGFEPPAPPAPGSIGDRVWNDVDGDGIQDPGESGVNGAVVALLVDLNNDGLYETQAATQTTAGDGSYLFENLPPGSYRVVLLETPAGMTPTTPSTVLVGLGAGITFLDADFGLTSATPTPGSIGDRVWNDENADGIQDPSEVGINNVTVELRRDNDGDGVYEEIVDTTVTSGDGNYTFADVPPGNLRVVVTPPAGYAPVTPLTIDVPLSAGQNVDTADVGLTDGPVPPGSIGDRVWSDTNRDQVQDPGEPGVNGVTVELRRDSDGDGSYDELVETTVTSDNGNYLFADVPPGSYLVVVTPPPGMAATTPDTVPVTITAGEMIDDVDIGLATPGETPFDLELDKTLEGTADWDGTATWLIVVKNNGIVASPDELTVTDALPEGLSYLGFEGAGWSCTHDNGIVTCTLPQSLAVGESVQLRIITDIELLPGATVTNTAMVSSDGVELTIENNSDQAETSVGGELPPPDPIDPTNPQPPTDPTPPTTPMAPTPVPYEPTPTVTTTGSLPVTGSNPVGLVAAGLALLLGGAGLVLVRRRLNHR